MPREGKIARFFGGIPEMSQNVLFCAFVFENPSISLKTWGNPELSFFVLFCPFLSFFVLFRFGHLVLAICQPLMIRKQEQDNKERIRLRLPTRR